MLRKRFLIPVILFSFGALALSLRVHATKSLTASDESKSKKINWATFDQGVELARKEKKILVVDVYTDWCHWCKVMDKDTFGNSEVVAFARENVIMAKLNAETSEKFKFRETTYSGRELATMFGVISFPTTIFMNSDGELITSVSGFIPADNFVLILKYLSGSWHEKMKFDEFKEKEKQRDNG